MPAGEIPPAAPARRPPRVLLLSASAGAGHVRAAMALEKAFQERGGCEVRHEDVLEHCTWFFKLLFRDVYREMTARVPPLMGYIYDRMDVPWRNPLRRRLLSLANTQPAVRFLRRWRPDLCISTHFLPAEIISRLRGKAALQTRHGVVITDFDVQALWLYKHVDRYYVAREEAAAFLERIGVSREMVCCSGIPVDPAFSRPLDKRVARLALGLDSEPFTVLISAGVLAATPIEGVVADLLAASRQWQIVAVTGKSLALRRRLEAIDTGARTPGGQPCLRVIGFTKEMDRWMAAADLLVGKAGGLTVSESLSLGLPMGILEPIPGVETRNADHLLEHGAAFRLNNPAVAAWKIAQLTENPARLEAMRAAARSLGRPRAAAQIAADSLKVLLGIESSQAAPGTALESVSSCGEKRSS